MISERVMASQFQSLWAEALPLLTPSFVRVFNEAYEDDLSLYPQGIKLEKISIGPKVEKHDLVSEFAFQLAKESAKKSIPATELESNAETVNFAFQEAISFLSHYEQDVINNMLNSEEIAESYLLAYQYEQFLKKIDASKVEFSPRIAGAGFMNQCFADLAVDNTLYEVKTVSRNISGNDIRQLFIYLALQASEGSQTWTHAGFFNPRRALAYRFSIDHFVYRTSGGKSTTEVFQNIVSFFSREIEFDTKF